MLKAQILPRRVLKSVEVPKRHLWEWLTFMFNKPDESRLKAVGADRACAEWILKNGGKVCLKGGAVVDNYNLLPAEHYKIELEAIDATGSAISHYGFDHLKNCNGIQSISLISCPYIEDPAFARLAHVSKSLQRLEVISCNNVTDKGILKITQLYNLKNLRMSALLSVKDLEKCKKEIKDAIPDCTIEF